MSAYCFSSKNIANLFLIDTEGNLNSKRVDMTFHTLIILHKKYNFTLIISSVTVTKSTALKQRLGGVPTKKVLLKLENVNRDK